jgi:asparagine synthetase B (glutamine-hydrolysing)
MGKREAIEALDRVLEKAVLDHTYEPMLKIAVWCSGGLDSSTLLYYLRDHNVTGIHLYFFPFLDTLPLFNGLTEALNVDGVSYEMTLSDHWRLLPEALRNHTIKMTAFPTMLLYMAKVSKEYDLILHGLGLDELFGGYRQHAQATDKDFPEVEQYYHDMVITRKENTEIQAKTLGLRIEAPFINDNLREICGAMPRKWKTRGHFTKIILRELMEGKIPVANFRAGAIAGTKGGFHPPIRGWWNNGLDKWCLKRLGIIDRWKTRGNLWNKIIRANEIERARIV